MDIVLLIIGIVFIATWLWLTILGSIAVNFDTTLDMTQHKSQKLIVLLVPIFGAVFILHLTNIHSPGVIPYSWVPWPLKSLVFGKDWSKNNTDNHENDRQ